MTTGSSTSEIPIMERLASWSSGFDRLLDEMLTPSAEVPEPLAEAMRYAAQGGGKRVRPFIVTRMCELCGGSAHLSAPAAVAMECIHAFSLVHDDLPAMDDDDLRRGRPTCHKVYGEAIAILAGDALQTVAFELLATRIDEPERVAKAVAELARGSGWAGMIGGQTYDIMGENNPTDLALVRKIHRYKTACLFESSARLGAITAGATDDQLQAATDFGRDLGIAFQIADDLLDVTGTTEQLGKAAAKDADAGKQTYPAAVGIEASRAAADESIRRAIEALEPFGAAADDLRELARFVVERRK